MSKTHHECQWLQPFRMDWNIFHSKCIELAQSSCQTTCPIFSSGELFSVYYKVRTLEKISLPRKRRPTRFHHIKIATNSSNSIKWYKTMIFYDLFHKTKQIVCQQFAVDQWTHKSLFLKYLKLNSLLRGLFQNDHNYGKNVTVLTICL